jgi:asparagine synthase (glutamine-hydrolysing)
MCGIAGIIDLDGARSAPLSTLEAMGKSLLHRGPDENGVLDRAGVGLVSQRLSIIGLQDGRQPISNEDGSVTVVFNGELFDYPEVRTVLQARGHRFATHCDTELLPHLWEEHQEAMLECLRGQFAFALWDARRRQLILARDRFGICPLYWTRQTWDGSDWLLFASEIKALISSGMVEARPEPRGINQVFTFMALPGPTTCFAGVLSLLPGHYLSIQLSAEQQEPVRIRDRVFWEIDFPDRGDEDRSKQPGPLVDEFEAVLLRAVERRLRADVPVVSYLSGGIDSSVVTALACHVRKEPIPTFTLRIQDPYLDETGPAGVVARHLGARPTVVGCGSPEVLDSYPQLIEAAEGPVIDTSSAALLLLAREVHDQNYKVALTGEGADEWLGGYSWFKIHKLLGYLDVLPELDLSAWLRRAYLRLTGAPRFPWSLAQRLQQAAGGKNAWLEFYGLIGLSKARFYSPLMREALGDHIPYSDLGLNHERMCRWHPFNRSLYLGARVHLAGHLLCSKGDRVAMHSSVETRYPFLDEDVFSFLARVHPRWKLHGFRDKHLLRLLAERWLPRVIARRRKAMFRAPFDGFHVAEPPAWVDQLLSPESLRRTGYFDPVAVARWRETFRQLRARSLQRVSVEMGLVGVLATQLWHHMFIDNTLAELPSRVNRVSSATEIARQRVPSVPLSPRAGV